MNDLNIQLDWFEAIEGFSQLAEAKPNCEKNVLDVEGSWYEQYVSIFLLSC